MGEEAEVGRLASVAGRERQRLTAAAGGHLRVRAEHRSPAATRGRRGGGRASRPASAPRPPRSSLRSGSRPGPPRRCTGWSAKGASRGWSGPASRSTTFGVPRSLDFRLTCELVSWTALVMVPATTDRSSGSSSKTGMSVGAQLVVVLREDAQVPPRLTGVQREVDDRAQDRVERNHLEAERRQVVGHLGHRLLRPRGHEGQPSAGNGDLVGHDADRLEHRLLARDVLGIELHGRRPARCRRRAGRCAPSRRCSACPGRK